MPYTNFEKTVDVVTPGGVRQVAIRFGPIRHEWNLRTADDARSFERIDAAQRYLDSLGEHKFDLSLEVAKFARANGRKPPTAES